MRHLIETTLMTGVIVTMIACSPASKEEKEDKAVTDQSETPYDPSPTVELGPTAVAELGEASESGVRGTVKFESTGDKMVRIEVKVQGISQGTHALHLHEKGDCSAPDAKSAGGHWNPANTKHGKRGEGQFHKGDITNLEVDDDGKIVWTEEIEGWTIGGPDSTNILNKAVIIHEGADDFTSQPSGDAGARIACGVIALKE